MAEQREIRERVAGMEDLLAQLASRQEAPGGAAGMAAVQALVDIYGEALARILDRADDALRDQLVEDELVSHLLLVHDLHPVEPESRVRDALERMRPQAETELLGMDEGVATVQLSASGCGSTVDTVRTSVEETVLAAAPEVSQVRVQMSKPDTTAFVPLSTVRAR